MKRLYFIISFASHRVTLLRSVPFVSFIRLLIMPVKTRSQKKQQQQQQQQQQQYNNTVANEDLHITATTASRSNKGQRRVKIVTPSFIEASTHTYKVYSPRNKPPHSDASGASVSAKKKKNTTAVAFAFKDEASDDAAAAAEALMALQSHDYDDDTSTPSSSETTDTTATDTAGSHQHHKCLNPMNPISKFIYRIGIYNIAQTVHYKTAYILYDTASRLYHVYTIISNQMSYPENDSVPVESRTEFTLPSPHNTIQTKYKSYIDDTITNFIMTMIIPSNEHDYYIQDDILGVVIQPQEFQKKAFDEESCFYDIEDLVYDNTSSETITGYKAFMMVPSRNFWYSPAGAYYYTPTEANTVAYHDNRYTSQTVGNVLLILSQSS